jgi:hypothetical protein
MSAPKTTRVNAKINREEKISRKGIINETMISASATILDVMTAKISEDIE